MVLASSARALARRSLALIYGRAECPACQRRFALDFRPHTHQWQVMRDVRATRTESGVIDLAGGSLCMFMTTWGDGGFSLSAIRKS